jgi:hypothetical protein
MASVDMTDRLRAWTHARQRLGEPARSPEDALRAVVAVYATHPTCPLALAVRTRSLTAARYRRMDSARKGLRIPAMRKTLFLVPAKSAPTVFTAVRQKPAEARRGLKRIKMSEREFERVATRVLSAAEKPVQARALEDAAGVKRQELQTVLRALRYEGRLLAVAGQSLMMSAHGYVAAGSWMDEQLDAGDQDQALEWLAGEYLRAYGPARVADFAWWSGVTKTRARAALDEHRTVDVGDGLLLLKRDEAAFGRVKKLRGTVDLLPKWDAYTMGHAPDGRRRFVHPDVQKPVYTPIGTGLAGDGNPVVLVDGGVAGLWSYTIKEGPRVQPFDKLGPTVRRKVDATLDRLVRFLAG